MFLPSNIFTRPSLQASFAQGRSDAQPAIVVFSRYNSFYRIYSDRFKDLETYAVNCLRFAVSFLLISSKVGYHFEGKIIRPGEQIFLGMHTSIKTESQVPVPCPSEKISRSYLKVFRYENAVHCSTHLSMNLNLNLNLNLALFQSESCVISIWILRYSEAHETSNLISK